ncbi:MAG: PilZ domain-containing protein [Candidatus Omnitrophica bacterium]|nr:PilZ domain-containing protein [Candidatus Omnitrophota bacterium]MBU1127681.1 PilZ domain-containing protein [Candidatus Omnitrophota bacterium]MBU1657347.1 PilZ domain-containing protein [Candidatus Omnitrophota bacterium]MBU1851470.1 PilZ domain-containing protein [Candidatus Omnitrophota bacterium]
MQERRKYPRYDVSHPVSYCDVARDPERKSEEETKTEDVSRGGIRVKINRIIEDGRILNLKVRNSSYPEPVDADARVVWVEKTLDDEVLLGLSFTRIGWIESDKLLTPEILRTQV